MRSASLVLCSLLLLTAVSSPEGESRSLVENGSFERVVPGAPVKDSGQGAWKIGGEGMVPSGWSLNTGYPGTLTVLTEGAAAGERCVRVAAGTKRDAQLYRPCAAVRPGSWYRISARVRDGAATVLVYEYGKGRAVMAHSLASGTGGAGAWRQVTGFYSPVGDDFGSASVALLVPKGTSAVLDDVVVTEMEGVSPAAGARAVRLENREVELSISPMGRLESLVLKATGQDYADARAPTPVLSAVRDGVRIPLGSLTNRGNTWTARFADPAVVARIRVVPRDRYFQFQVVDAAPADLESLELRFPVKPQRVRDAWMPGTHGDDFGICHMGITANTEVLLGRYGASVAPEARWYGRHGIEGGRSALIATGASRFLETIRRMELDTGLPSPVLPSGGAGETASNDWARQSPALLRSYLFATYLGPADLDALIRYAKIGGFGLIMLHRASWRATAGHETIARAAFPEGLPDLVAACEKIHAAGLRVGLHLYGPSVSLDDAYVTPVPDPRLFAIEVGRLGARAGADATELTLERTPDLPRRASPGTWPGDLLRIGDEIVRWREMVPGTPARLLGCERGALGTTARARRVGEEVRSLALSSGRILPDPDTDLPEEMGGHLARVVNATGADLVYFDGASAAPEGRQPERWYYMNRTLLASCAKFDHGVLVQTSMGPGQQLAWHLVPRGASADGHGDLKGYLDRRLAGILQLRRTFHAADIGWYALDIHGRPDELEYVCAKALATGSSVSVQAHRPLLETHPHAREVFEMIARWERRRLAGDVPAELRTRLLAEGRDFRLLEDGEAWSFWEAEYEADRPIPALDGAANRWAVPNEGGRPVRLALEIRREPVATTPPAHGGPDSAPVIDLSDLSGFGDPADPRLVEIAQIGDRRIHADGLSLRGVRTTLEALAGAPAGAPAALFSAENTTNGAGWCTTGRRLAEPLDLSGAKALGLWVRGDGHGQTLNLVLSDSDGRYARFAVAVNFEGWRFRSFPRQGSIDWSRIEHVVLELNHIAPRAKVSAGVAAIRAVPDLHVPGPIRGLTLTLGGRTVEIPVALAPDRVLTIDALGRGVHWPGGMAEGQPFEVEGGALVLPPGSSPLEIQIDPEDGYAGDLSVRVCRTWPLDD